MEDCSRVSTVVRPLGIAVGTLVRTVDQIEQRDFTDEAHKYRFPNRRGRLVAVWGDPEERVILLQVGYLRGGSGWFDPDEIISEVKA